jgi:Ser/Thr protein kinase RdoA (MazF antagonist)
MTPFFPSTYSTLSALSLADMITEKYRLTNVQCRFLVRGVGDTYLVETSDSRFILRVYRSSHRSLPQIRMEVELLVATKQAGVPVSYPIPDLSGAFVQTLIAIEGERHAVLFTYAPGKTVRALNESQLRVLGTQMALFHNVSSTIQLKAERWTFDTETTLFIPLRRLKNYFADFQEDYFWLEQAARQVVSKLERIDKSSFSTGYCHFDFLPKNFHFEEDQITFFDFDFMGYGWLINDLTSFWQHLQLDVYAGRMKQEEADSMFFIFLSSYRERRPVSEDELAAMPYLSLGFWLFYMGFHTTHDQFFPNIQPVTLKAYTGFLRNLAQQHWTFPALNYL